MRFERTEVWGFEHAIRGARNPMNSWDKSDSGMGCENWGWDQKIQKCKDCYPLIECHPSRFIIGPNDMALLQRLIKAGSEHRKFMRQIMVSVDITAPLYW